MVRRMAHRASVGARHDCRDGTVPPKQMSGLQQPGSGDDAWGIPEEAGEVRLNRIIRWGYGGDKQREQPGDAD